MSRARAAVGSFVFLLIAPGVVAGLIPWLITDWEANDWWLPIRIVGAILIAVGAAVLLNAFARFVIEGFGTPAPVAPPQQLVIGGLYCYVRNPMYLAVEATIVGQALFLGQPSLLLYALAFAAIVAAFVYGYEQPTLERQFGDQYEEYKKRVPAWIPRRPSDSPKTGVGS